MRMADGITNSGKHPAKKQRKSRIGEYKSGNLCSGTHQQGNHVVACDVLMHVPSQQLGCVLGAC